jgi:hypothetical protein
MSDSENLTEPMVIWRVKRVSCDGGQIGSCCAEWFFLDEAVARKFYLAEVESKNKVESERQDTFIIQERERCEQEGKRWWRMYSEDIVEGILGYCCWAYGSMYILDSVSVEK